MYRRSAGILAASALGASALILPPGIAAVSSHHDGPLPSIANPKSQLIQLPCPACDFPLASDSAKSVEAVDDLYSTQRSRKDIQLNFTVSQDGTELELAGSSLYAPTAKHSALASGNSLYVHQISTAASDIADDELRKVPLEISFLALTTEAEVRASPDGDVIVQLQLKIMGLEGVTMQFDGVRIHLLKTGAGELIILHLEAVPATTQDPLLALPNSALSAANGQDMKDCKESMGVALCKLSQMVGKISSMRPSIPGRLKPLPDLKDPPPPPPTRPAPNADHLDFEKPSPHHHGRPHHMRPYGGSHYHAFSGINSFVRSVISILIPVLAGITVGLLVSLLGLVVGRVIGFYWVSECLHANASEQRRRSRRCRRHHRAAEGKILLTEDYPEPLPLYEDAPAYEEVESHPK